MVFLKEIFSTCEKNDFGKMEYSRKEKRTWFDARCDWSGQVWQVNDPESKQLVVALTSSLRVKDLIVSIVLPCDSSAPLRKESMKRKGPLFGTLKWKGAQPTHIQISADLLGKFSVFRRWRKWADSWARSVFCAVPSCDANRCHCSCNKKAVRQVQVGH